MHNTSEECRLVYLPSVSNDFTIGDREELRYETRALHLARREEHIQKLARVQAIDSCFNQSPCTNSSQLHPVQNRKRATEGFVLGSEAALQLVEPPKSE